MGRSAWSGILISVLVSSAGADDEYVGGQGFVGLAQKITRGS